MDKSFAVKNGLVVNNNLIFADPSVNRVGIANSTPDATLTITGTANVSGNVVIGGNETIGGNLVVGGVSTFSSNVNITGSANVSVNVNVAGRANVGGNVAITGSETVGGNVAITGSETVGGNTTITGSANIGINLNVNGYISTALVNVGTASVNSTIFTGTANNANNFGGQLPAYYANATNLTSGTVAAGRLPTGNSTAIGGLQIVDSVSNTSATVAASANAVKTAYDASSGAGVTAYSNAINFAANSGNANNGTLPAGRLTGAYGNVTQVGNLSFLNVTGVINAAANVTIGGNANVAGSVTILGDLTVTGNVVSVGTQSSNGNFIPSVNNYSLGDSTHKWNVVGNNTTLDTSLLVGANVTINTTMLWIGNSTVNASVNSTIFTGTANNSTNFGGQPSSYYANATNLTSGTVAAGRLPTGNSTAIGGLQIVDSVSNTSATITSSANSVKVTYDLAVTANTATGAAYTNAVATAAADATTKAATAYANAIAFAANATNANNGTLAAARLPTGNSTAIGGLQIVDSVSNTSATITSSANSVKVTYDLAQNAISNATSAYTNAVASSSADASAKAATSYANAIAIAANATNLTSGTVAAGRLPTGNSTAIGGLQIVDSVSNTSATVAAAANSVTTTYNYVVGLSTAVATQLITVGNSTINAVINSTSFSIGPNINILTNSITVGNSTSNSVQLQTGFYVGNSTVNSSVNSSMIVVNSNSAIQLPRGNTGQQPAPSNGMVRFNTETASFEGYIGSAWGSIGGGGYFKGDVSALGSPSNANSIFRINSQVLNNNTTINADENAQATGPITILTGKTLTIATGGRVAII